MLFRLPARSRSLRAALASTALLVGMLVGLSQGPAAAAVTTVKGSACSYFVNVGLFGGPQTLNGCGSGVGPTSSSFSPNVTLPPGGSAAAITQTDADGAKATYGPAVIHGGIWPENVNSPTASGPQSASTQGTPAGGTVTSTADIMLKTPPYPVVPCAPGFPAPCSDPGGFGPPPVWGDSVHAQCTANEAGVSGSSTFSNSFLATATDVEGSPLPAATEPIPNNPPVNYTRSGVITNVGDVFTVVFNQQIVNPDKSLTVNAVHLYLFGPTAVGELVRGQVSCGTTPSSAVSTDTVAPSCGTPVVKPVSPEDPTPQVPRTELIGVFDAGMGAAPSGIQSITNILASNATVRVGDSTSTFAYLNFVPGQTGPLPVTATRTNEALPMSWSFDVTDAAGNVSHCQGLAAPAFTSASPPVAATVGAAYSFPFTASGSPAPTFAVNSGALPAGLSLSAATGVLSGTPTAVGTSTFTIRAANGVSPNAVTPSISITVAPAPVAPGFTASSPSPSATVGAAYSYTFTASGSPAPTFAVNSGALPAGLSLNATTGVLSGTPTAVGTSTFTIRAANGVSPNAVTSSITVTVSTTGTAPAFTAASPAAGATVGTAYSYTFTASGSPAPTFSVSSGSLPTGLTLNGATGVLSGTPTVAGGSTFTIRAANGISPEAVTPSITVTVRARFSTFVPLSPVRILDTRSGNGAPTARVGAGGTVDVQVTGRGGVPGAGVTAVALNVTAVAPTAGSFVTAWPTGESRPNASNVNLDAGRIVPNLTIVKVGTGGRVSVYNASGTIDLLADVAGYYLDPAAATPGSSFTSVTPARILDTRTGTGAPAARVGVGQTVDVQVTGQGGLPATGVSAVAVNVTAVNPSGTSFVTGWPTGEGRPDASNLNLTAGVTRPNMVIVKVGAGGKVSLFNDAGTVDLLADVAGYYLDPTATPASTFTAVSPARILDTRTGAGAPLVRVGPGRSVDVQVAGQGGVPATGVTSVVMNVTSAAPSATSFVTAWPTGESRPNASSLNLTPGVTVANLVVVKVGAAGTVSLFNESGTTDLLADVAGYNAT